jgi:hypothetical protein
LLLLWLVWQRLSLLLNGTVLLSKTRSITTGGWGYVPQHLNGFVSILRYFHQPSGGRFWLLEWRLLSKRRLLMPKSLLLLLLLLDANGLCQGINPPFNLPN